MAKVSRPVVITAVLGALGYVGFLLYGPDDTTSTTKHHTSSSQSTATADADGILPEDRLAHFTAYAGPRRDAFNPKVASRGPDVKVNPLSAMHGSWTLTGINSINGDQSALMENAATGESVFLKPGDQWNGQKVVQIGESVVTLVGPTGAQSLITFPNPDDGSSKSNAAAGAALAAVPAEGAAPAESATGPLPPAPVNLPAPPGFTAPNQ